MLNTTTISSGIENGERYYTEEEGYYSEDEEIQAITKSEWFGNMAPNEPYSASNLDNGCVDEKKRTVKDKFRRA